jgi:hypothetical protein
MSEWTREELAKRSDEQIAVIAARITNRLAKWRTWLASWQMGTQLDGHGPTKAVKNHHERTILLRAEVNALTALLIDKGVFTERELTEQVILECEMLAEQFSKAYPGVSAAGDGLSYLLPEAGETMRGLGFPP